jgi:hypothetical protein
MENRDVCGCGGNGTYVSNRPLFELRNLLDMLERQEEARKAKEMKAAGNNSTMIAPPSGT